VKPYNAHLKTTGDKWLVAHEYACGVLAGSQVGGWTLSLENNFVLHSLELRLNMPVK